MVRKTSSEWMSFKTNCLGAQAQRFLVELAARSMRWSSLAEASRCFSQGSLSFPTLSIAVGSNGCESEGETGPKELPNDERHRTVELLAGTQ